VVDVVVAMGGVVVDVVVAMGGVVVDVVVAMGAAGVVARPGFVGAGIVVVDVEASAADDERWGRIDSSESAWP
jgi:hypothetical protein